MASKPAGNKHGPTSNSDYKLWFDYLFDALEHRLTFPGIRIVIALLFAGFVFATGLMIALGFGRANEYLRTGAIYLVCAYIALSLTIYRWISEMYHERTKRVRNCFFVDDETFSRIAHARAQRATSNGPIILFTFLLTAIAWTYYAAVTIDGPLLPSRLLDFYPPSVPLDRQLSTMLIIYLYNFVLVFLATTAVRISITFTGFLRDIRTLPVRPWPALIVDRFDGVLDLTLAGVVLFAVADVMIALLYLGPSPQASGLTKDGFTLHLLGAEISVGIVAILLVLAAVLQGILVFVLPRIVSERILARAKHGLREQLWHRYIQIAAYDEIVDSSMTQELASLSELLRTEAVTRGQIVTLAGVLGFLGSQLITLVPLAVQYAIGFQGK